MSGKVEESVAVRFLTGNVLLAFRSSSYLALVAVDFRVGVTDAGSLNNAGWSSPVAREAHNLEVVGSNPAPATFRTWFKIF